MTKKERKEIQDNFKQEVKDLYNKGISVNDIAGLKKLTTARVYQILGLNAFKKTK